MKWPKDIRDRQVEYAMLFRQRLGARLARQFRGNLKSRYLKYLRGSLDEDFSRLLHFFGSAPTEGKLALLDEGSVPPSYRLIRMVSSAGSFAPVQGQGPFRALERGYLEIFERECEALKRSVAEG